MQNSEGRDLKLETPILVSGSVTLYVEALEKHELFDTWFSRLYIGDESQLR